MHDIDAQISKISGQSNYMDYLQKVTGNILNVDMNLWHEKHTKIYNCDNNIRKVLERIQREDDSITPIVHQYMTVAIPLDIEHKAFYMHAKKSSKSKKVRPPREKISPGYQPSDLVKTEWFKQIKHIEKAVNKFLVEVFPKPQEPQQAAADKQPTSNVAGSTNAAAVDIEKHTYDELQAEFDAHPELIDIKTIFDVKITNKNLYNNFLMLKRFCRIIINILLMPMYDVRQTIESHWEQIDKIFKSKAFQTTQIASTADIVDILQQFIIAKYRATVTGNNKHYVRLFFDAVGNDSISNMDGARFLEIMDAIDLDKLDKDDKVYKFANAAKSTMQKIANNEAVTPELLQEFDAMFTPDDTPNDSPTEADTMAVTASAGADIFNSSDSDYSDDPKEATDDIQTNEEPTSIESATSAPQPESNT